MVPVVVFLAFIVVSLWVRRRLYNYLEKILVQAKWEGSNIFLNLTRHTFFQWCLILGGYTSIQISQLSSYVKYLSGKIFGSIFIASLTWTILALVERLLRLYFERVKALPATTMAFIVNGVKIGFIIASILILLDVWGMPTTPLMLLLAIVLLIAIFASRDEMLNILAGIEIGQNNLVKIGDYVKLESGDEGYITRKTWNNIQLKTLDEKTLLIPNSKFIKMTVAILGKPQKQASQPFRFFTRLHLKELTGLKAKNLSELVAILKDADDSVIYYHTHNFIEEYQYLTPQPANDFALWVSDALGDEVLGEKLANIDTFEFLTIGTLRERLVDFINEELSKKPGGRDAPPGREFHFIRSLSAIIPTFHVVHDLREFIEVLRTVSIDTLYFHIFEARLRLHKGVNDFSIWLNDCLDEKELADKIAILDPYAYSLESLRTMIIQLAEKHLEKEQLIG